MDGLAMIMAVLVMLAVHMMVDSTVVVATKVTISAIRAGMTSRALNFKSYSYHLLFSSVEFLNVCRIDDILHYAFHFISLFSLF